MTFLNNYIDFIAHSSVSSIASTSVSWQRSQHFHDGTLQGCCRSTNWCINILTTRNDSILSIKVTSLRARVQNLGIIVQKIDICNGFCTIFSHYNKIQYKTEWKWVIFLLFQEKWCCRLNIDFYGARHELRYIYVTNFPQL